MLHGGMSVQSLSHAYHVNESTICTMYAGIIETLCSCVHTSLSSYGIKSDQCRLK
jgi:hypothetical protein